ncbi:MAG: hypothetical protein JXA30_18345 [Deltaproteobacteria bacterium]|nr:hypothetical protein [Deltaproteobacteria bacterium]
MSLFIDADIEVKMARVSTRDAIGHFFFSRWKIATYNRFTIPWLLLLIFFSAACTDLSQPRVDSGYQTEKSGEISDSDATTREPVRSTDCEIGAEACELSASSDAWISTEAAGDSTFITQPPAATNTQQDSPFEPRPMPSISKPEVVGTLVGPDARYANGEIQVYGTDMGSTFVHQGRHLVLFGDTWPNASFICDHSSIENDDTIATIPLDYTGGIPPLNFFTKADSPSEPSLIQLFRGNESLSLGFGLIPMVGFSDGDRAFAFFTRLERVACDTTTAPAPQGCPIDGKFFCSTGIGICEPELPILCDVKLNQGCIIGQQCVAASLCVDSTSSQYAEGDVWSEMASIALSIDIAVQDQSNPELFNSVFSWPTNKFSVLTARAVKVFSEKTAGNDYQSGTGHLLIWGRPGFVGENDHGSDLYLATHALPFVFEAGALAFQPRYFAGLDSQTGEPIWSSLQSDAAPLALDGVVSGDPYEEVPMVGHMTVGWLGSPIDKWVLLYGGDLVDYLLSTPTSTRFAQSPGAIIIRFADHPWGPWSDPLPHLAPGSPSQIGDPYGPGGFLYHPECTDEPPALCARPNPYRPLDTVIACIISIPDPGRLYAPSIIDGYTAPNARGGLDMFWNVSTWNPYTVMLLKTSVFPTAAK